MIKSLSYEQDEILDSIESLYLPIECDVTYGSGVFYKNRKRPEYCFDLDPKFDFVVEADSRKLPLESASINSLMFDPPFLTYIRNDSIMKRRFSGYWSYDELESHYKGTLKEAYRVLRKKGILVVKCQDLIHNHTMHPTHVNVINWTKDMFQIKDIFILAAKHRMPTNPRHKGNQTQKHARIFHSYFLVFKRK